jgi:hypothetical protein
LHQFTLDETDVLYRHDIPVLMEYRLPHGWHMSAAGYVVLPPSLDGRELRSIIEEQRMQMTPEQRYRSWWFGRDVDGTLAAYGYRPRRRGDPPRWPLYFPEAQHMARFHAGGSNFTAPRRHLTMFIRCLLYKPAIFCTNRMNFVVLLCFRIF